jgi:hypothetical protein
MIMNMLVSLRSLHNHHRNRLNQRSGSFCMLNKGRGKGRSHWWDENGYSWLLQSVAVIMSIIKQRIACIRGLVRLQIIRETVPNLFLANHTSQSSASPIATRPTTFDNGRYSRSLFWCPIGRPSQCFAGHFSWCPSN